MVDPDTRSALIGAAKSLIWERGLAATSPNSVLERSGVGKGSLYHFFASKNEWALAAIESLASELTAETQQIFLEAPNGLAALDRYLSKSRSALDGCRLGRLAFDPAVVAEPRLRVPINTFLQTLDGLIRDALSDAGIGASADQRADIAASISAVVQGGYVIARMADDTDALSRACRGLFLLLDHITPGREDSQ